MANHLTDEVLKAIVYIFLFHAMAWFCYDCYRVINEPKKSFIRPVATYTGAVIYTGSIFSWMTDGMHDAGLSWSQFTLAEIDRFSPHFLNGFAAASFIVGAMLLLALYVAGDIVKIFGEK